MGEGDEGFWVRLEALAMHDRGAGFVVLLFADPHLLEGGEGGQDGATNPDGVLALRWGDDLGGERQRRAGGDQVQSGSAFNNT